MRRLNILALTVLLAGCATRSGTGAPERYTDVAAYREARQRLIEQERAGRRSASLPVTPEEAKANSWLMALKESELARTRAYFPPAHSFLEDKTKQLVENSPVFEVMKQLPKGAVLHAHGSAMGDYRWLVSHATHRPDCYMYVAEGGQTVRGSLRIADRPPAEGWRLVTELRGEATDANAFDEAIYRSITLGEEDVTAADIWEEFSNVFRRSSGLFAQPSVRADYWRAMLEGLIADNVQYLETRTPPIDIAIVREVQRSDPDFDVKFIPAAGRSSGHDRVRQALASVVEGRLTDPDRIKGFDLVEEEDRTPSNLAYVEELLAARREADRRGVSLPLYLHSGESNWIENENLYDAVLLGASRIGHGLALVKHPLLMEMVKTRGIAVEVCPISNQILGFVPDLRNHPAVSYINAGLPVVLSSDDPGIMRHSLSHDFYVAFMAWGLDLRDLKQLAIDSLVHSAMNSEEKRKALAAWSRRWDVFVQQLNARVK
jgi:adenosine deaminase CECR1